jgi:hypothetical protein
MKVSWSVLAIAPLIARSSLSHQIATTRLKDIHEDDKAVWSPYNEGCDV